MRSAVLLALTLSAALSVLPAEGAHPRGFHHGDRMCAGAAPWHTWYYNPEWGTPVALVVPPTAEFQSHYAWGVGGTRTNLIGPQFGRNYPGYSQYDPRLFRPTPPWPSDTDQLGYNYVRGPWR